MKPIVQHTADGSVTLFNPILNVTYHSRFGALQESRHIYLHHGLNTAINTFGKNLNVLEMGFGTGLNAWLTQQEAEHNKLVIKYTAIEKYPVPEELFAELNYANADSSKKDYSDLLQAAWETPFSISNHFSITKLKRDINSATFPNDLHLVYYDAFGPEASPESWSPEIFQRLFNVMCIGGVLVTFCAKGKIKRLLKETGFKVESPAGPPGKREMTRAIKL